MELQATTLDLSVARYSLELDQATKRAADCAASSERKHRSLKAEDITYWVEQVLAEFNEPTVSLEKLIGTLPSIMRYVEGRVKHGGDKRQTAQLIFEDIMQACAVHREVDWAAKGEEIEKCCLFVIDEVVAINKRQEVLNSAPKMCKEYSSTEQGFLACDEVTEQLDDQNLTTDPLKKMPLSCVQRLAKYFTGACIDSEVVHGITQALEEAGAVNDLTSTQQHEWTLALIEHVLIYLKKNAEEQKFILTFSNGTIPILQWVMNNERPFLKVKVGENHQRRHAIECCVM